MLNLAASLTAILSQPTSTTKIASGKPPIFFIPPKARSSLVSSRIKLSASFLVIPANFLLSRIASKSFKRLIDFLIVL